MTVVPVVAHGPVKGQHLAGVLRDGGAKPPAQDILLAILMDNYRLSRTPEGEPVAAANQAPSVALTLRGKGGLRKRLAADMFRLTNRSPSQDALANTLGTLEGLAETIGSKQRLYVRTGVLEGAALLDLGREDGLTAWIKPGEWNVYSRLPVLWRRGAMIGELPVPCRPGTGRLAGAAHLFNFREDGQWVTAVACQVAALLYPAGTHPVEIYSADSSGALKTATLRNMKNWTDPGPTIPLPKDGKSWATVASKCYRVAIDNVSTISPWWSDLLCKSASGDAWADRELYSDGDVSAWQFSAVPMLDGIGLVALRDDLADRAVRHHLTRPRYFLGDDEVSAQWDREHPSLLGWLLDVSAQVSLMHAQGRVPRPRTGRMAVFEWVIAALDALWGMNGAGMAWYKASQGEAAADAVSADLVATAVTEAVTSAWQGYPAELFRKIEHALPLTDEQGRAWSAQKFGLRLPRAASAVTKLGWQMERTEPDRHRRRAWVIAPPADSWQRAADS